jgi:hypothetical protein
MGDDDECNDAVKIIAGNCEHGLGLLGRVMFWTESLLLLRRVGDIA